MSRTSHQKGITNVQGSFQRGCGIHNHIAKLCWLIEKSCENHVFDYKKVFNYVDYEKLWRALQDLADTSTFAQVGAISEHKPGSHYANTIWRQRLV